MAYGYELAVKAGSSMGADEVVPVEGGIEVDRDTFCRLYDEHYPRVFSFVLKRVGSVHDSEDITARTFEKALQHIRTYDPAKGSFSSWLYGIAVNATNDFFKARKGQVHVSLDELEDVLQFDAHSDPIAAVREFADLLGVIRKLNSRHQVVLVLKHMEGLSHDDISEVIGCSRKALSMRLTRATRAFERVAVEEGLLAGGDGR